MSTELYCHKCSEITKTSLSRVPFDKMRFFCRVCGVEKRGAYLANDNKEKS